MKTQTEALKLAQRVIQMLGAPSPLHFSKDEIIKWQECNATIKEVLAQPEQEPVAHDGTATEGGARYQADQHLRALLRYTENFYGVAIKHGMRAGETANAIAHIEKAGKALHELVHAWAGVAETRTTPSQRKPLTYVDLRRIANQCGLGANEVSAQAQAKVDNFARAIEAVHGIKGRE